MLARSIALVFAVSLAACGSSSSSAIEPDPPSGRIPPDPGSELSLTTDDGAILHGTVWVGTRADAPAVVMLHQLSSDRSEWGVFKDRVLGDMTVLAIDLRGHGKSTERKDLPPRGWKTFDTAAWAKLPLDAKAAVAYLRARETPPSSIVIVGASIGSSAALLYAADDPAIRGVAMLSPGTSYRGLDTVAALARYGTRPLLLISSRDDTRSADAVQKLATTHGSAEQTIFDGGGHGVSVDRTSPKLVDVVATFLLRTAGAAAK